MADVAKEMESDNGEKLPVLQSAAALTTSFMICTAAMHLKKLCGIRGGSLAVISAIVVVLATILPRYFGYLAPAGDAMALVLLQVTPSTCINIHSILIRRVGSAFIVKLSIDMCTPEKIRRRVFIIW